jgi:hypothetical protein
MRAREERQPAAMPVARGPMAIRSEAVQARQEVAPPAEQRDPAVQEGARRVGALVSIAMHRARAPLEPQTTATIVVMDRAFAHSLSAALPRVEKAARSRPSGPSQCCGEGAGVWRECFLPCLNRSMACTAFTLASPLRSLVELSADSVQKLLGTERFFDDVGVGR